MSTKIKMAIMVALATIVAAPTLASQSKQSNDAVHPGNAATRAYGPIFSPHKGVVDDACNLPSSRCPNQLRDVN
jgi:hypothetical protein